MEKDIHNDEMLNLYLGIGINENPHCCALRIHACALSLTFAPVATVH